MSTAAEIAASRRRFIAGPAYDAFFFLGPPLLALALGILISDSWVSRRTFALFGNEKFTLAGLFIGMFIHAHLVLVAFRSHGNATVRRTFPYRFLLVPLVLFVAMMSSSWIIVSVSVLATFWDVYHSGMQTFGLARIYDRKAGNDPNEGRRLDMILNQLLYAGPIVAGATMLAHFEDFYEFRSVGDTFFTAIPVAMQSHQRYLTIAVLAAGALFLVYYLLANVRAHLRGRRVSPQKIFLLVTTGACSIYTWGFNSWGEAFFIMNFFHALQYFGLVWWSENDNLSRLFRVQSFRFGKLVTWLLFVGIAMAYGLSVEAINGVRWFYALTLLVSIMHFWWDGFIWSVRKGQVTASTEPRA